MTAEPAARPIALLDVEASGGKPLCYPIEVGWCFAGSSAAESHLLRPAADWTMDSDCWQWHAYRVHHIHHKTLVAKGEPIEVVAERMNAALNGADVYADDHQDARWIARLFEAAGIPQAFVVRPMHELHQRFGATHVAQEAKAIAKTRQPPTHRAGGDALHLAAYVAALQELAGDRPQASAPYMPRAKVLRVLQGKRKHDVALDALCARAVELERGGADKAESPEAAIYAEIIALLERIRARFADAAREAALKAEDRSSDGTAGA